jgi:hypothetical protein
MTERTITIDDFVEINIFITNSRDSIETSAYAEINDLFASHLKESFNDPEELKKYGIDVYKIKIGDKLRIYPSKWTLWFCKDKNIPLGDNYDFDYEVANIEMQYFSRNPAHELEFPKLKIKVELKRS